MRWLLLTPIVQSMTVFELWDDEAFQALATRAVSLARDYRRTRPAPRRTGLPIRRSCVRRGVRRGGGPIQESDAIAVATGNAGLFYAWLLVGAWRGVEAEAMKFINAGSKR